MPTWFCSSPSSSTSVSKLISEQPHLSMLDRDCASMKDLQKLHAHFIKTGLSKHTIAASRVLAFCASPSGNMDYARLVFMQIHERNLFTWNTIIRGFSQSSTPQAAISLFVEMLVSSPIEPHRLTYPSVFKAYSQLGLALDGVQLHGRIIKLGLVRDQFIRNTILYMYANCGFLNDARKIFTEEMAFDVVAWNSMIMGLAKSGEIKEARKLFDSMPLRNSISWNSMISGYVRNGKLVEAMELFSRMQEQRIEPSEHTMVSLLNASAHLGALKQGEWIHNFTRKKNFCLNSIVMTAIIEMYSKCGAIEKALQVFEAGPKNGLSIWNAMILGLANNGRENEAILLFRMLELSDISPDNISFLGVLLACSHSRKVAEACYYFLLMSERYKIEPSVKHYSCMVDVLGRAGLLQEAEDLIKSLPMKPDAIIWGSLLSSCRMHGNTEMAKRAAGHVIALSPEESSGYVLLSNAYAAGGRFGEAMGARVSMKVKQIEKEPGCSVIEVHGEIHEFVASGMLHPRAPEIYLLLDELKLMLQSFHLFGT